ncbi:MAG TPA: glycosyltransferase, partial [Halieaceae bacterium]|nr:glycosyltransferase [Halieaceae bacterium]
MTAPVTIVIPVYNERPVLPELQRRLDAVLAGAGERAELLFVDDGSEDGSGAWLEALAGADPRVSLLSLSRNFGKEAAVSAGLDHARGAAVIVIDADLQ